MKLSVIIYVDNINDSLDKCISSIKNQTEKSIEVILVCNKTLSSSLKEKYNDFVVISKETDNKYSLINDGIRKSKGEYISIINENMILKERMYEDMLFQRADICSCSYIQDGLVIKQELYSKLASIISIDDNLYNKMFKRELIVNNLFSLDDDVITNKLFIYKVVGMSNTFGFVPEVSYDIRCKKEMVDYTKIYRTLDEITKFYKIKKLYEKDKSKLEYVHVKEILVYAFKYFKKIKDKNTRKKMLDDNWYYLNEKYPNWRKNLYVKRMPGLKSLTLRVTDKFIYDIKSKIRW